MRTQREDECSTCEVCDAVEPSPGAFVYCEGFIVCDDCAHKHGHKLAQMHDDLNEELRGD